MIEIIKRNHPETHPSQKNQLDKRNKIKIKRITSLTNLTEMIRKLKLDIGSKEI